MHEDKWLCERAILAPKSESVNKINSDILSEVAGEITEYLSVDTVMDTEQSTSYPVEFLNSLELSGVPSHKLQLKLGVPVMLMRNLDAPRTGNEAVSKKRESCVPWRTASDNMKDKPHEKLGDCGNSFLQ
ncbi:unnamed protein product [Parnassius apollo]|uniref:(apollo) hypothetical protein n=1 Tax=Parnassius apollo TaxID=110799 RepID=A0A8S3X1J7_PARAO|nr:unnamed protein product [Parnassius apollo]